MRSDNLFILSSWVIALSLIVYSTFGTKGSQYTVKAIGSVNATFQYDLDNFTRASELFTVQIIKYQEIERNVLFDEDFLKVKSSYLDMRVAFKRVEFFLEYLDKEAFDQTMNGAPLPKLEQKVADLVILEPKGLQVIDELMTSPPTEETLQELALKTRQLENDTKQLAAFLKTRTIHDRQFFEASRQGLVRLMTLGITGFDTPGTTLGLLDGEVVMRTLLKYYAYYDDELLNVHRKKLGDDVHALFSKALQKLEGQNFSTFNRLEFIKEAIIPLYAITYEVHEALDYEKIDEVSRYPLAVNYDARNFFDKDFLNPFYYVSLSEQSKVADMATLGKLLFYDPILSSNNKMSCASCHAPEKAFTDGEVTSKSIEGLPLKRNAMTLNYAVFASKFFHDMRAKRLEDQFEHVIVNEKEFNSDYKEVIQKLKSSPSYSSQFRKIFGEGDKAIRANNIDYAIAAYVMQLNTFDNMVDQFFQGKVDHLPPDVVRGFNLFSGKAACASCHFMPLYSGNLPPLFVDSEAEVLGVPEHIDSPKTVDDDKGRASNGVTNEIAFFYKYAFKTPTLRNIELTAPYMHNGVFNTLEAVMEFYNEGGGQGRGAQLDYQTLAPEPLNLTSQEIADIIAFMKALNDQTVFHAPNEIPRDFPTAGENNRVLLN